MDGTSPRNIQSADTLSARHLRNLAEYLTLVKTRITAMVMFTAWCGAYLGRPMPATQSALGWPRLTVAIFGIGLVAAGTAAANQVMERSSDARMEANRASSTRYWRDIDETCPDCNCGDDRWAAHR